MLDVASIVDCKTAEQKTETESYQRMEYNLFPAPCGAFVGDVMPMVDNGTLELFYLYDTDHNGQAYHPIHKFTTKNLFEYEDHGLMIGCGKTEEPDLALGTGSVLKGQDGRYHCFYTGHNDVMGQKGFGKECIMHAVSPDKEHWEKVPSDTFFPEENFAIDDFRDPFVFWNAEEKCYWMLLSTREDSLGGIIARYTSDDLRKWNLCGPLYAPQSHYMLECPDLFRFGNYYYLFYSWNCVTYYAISESIYGPFVEPENNVLDGTGFVFYAAKTAQLNGKRYLCGWVGRTDLRDDHGPYNWAGNMVIHELIQYDDGLLGIREPETLKAYFSEQLACNAVRTCGTVEEYYGIYLLRADHSQFALADFGVRPETVLLECDVVLGKEGLAGFAFGQGTDYENFTCLTLDAKNHSIHYEGTKLSNLSGTAPVIKTAFHFDPGTHYHVTLVAEKEIVVLYLDDAKALSSRIYHSIDGAHIALFAKEKEAAFHNLTIRIPDKS